MSIQNAHQVVISGARKKGNYKGPPDPLVEDVDTCVKAYVRLIAASAASQDAAEGEAA